MAAMGAEAALEELMEESVPAVMVLCEEIMYLAPLTTEDDKLLGLSLEMARRGSLDGRGAHTATCSGGRGRH